MESKSYRMAVFTHWANLGFLFVLGIGATRSIPFALLLAAIEVGILWILPDLPTVKAYFLQAEKETNLEKQRWYFLNALWGVTRPSMGLLGFLLGGTIPWVNVIDGYRSNPERNTFRHLCNIIEGLRSYRKVQPEAISEAQISKLDEMINGWLNLLYMAQTASSNLDRLNQRELHQEFLNLKEMRETLNKDSSTKVVLNERFRTLQDKVDSIPKLEQRRDLALAQAEAIVHHIESVDSRVRSAISIGADSLMDTTVDSMMDLPDQVTSAAEVRSILSGTDVESPEMWDNLQNKLSAR